MVDKIKISEQWLRDSILWHCSFYDGPLEGLCVWNGSLRSFKCVDHEAEDRLFEIESLTGYQKIVWLKRKWLFEICIGTHCSYGKTKTQNYFYFKRPKWFWQLIFNLYYRKNLTRD